MFMSDSNNTQNTNLCFTLALFDDLRHDVRLNDLGSAARCGHSSSWHDDTHLTRLADGSTKHHKGITITN